jgi:hypothetical protein
MPGKGRKKGTWKCPECSRFNDPSEATCDRCGVGVKPLPKPKPRPKPRPEQRVKMKQRSEAAKERERESGVGSNGLKKGMTEKEKRRARGRALASTPLANRLERGVQERLDRMRAEEEASDGR